MRLQRKMDFTTSLIPAFGLTSRFGIGTRRRRIVRHLFEKSTTRFAGSLFVNQATGNGCSFSPGEKVRMRVSVPANLPNSSLSPPLASRWFRGLEPYSLFHVHQGETDFYGYLKSNRLSPIHGFHRCVLIEGGIHNHPKLRIEPGITGKFPFYVSSRAVLSRRIGFG